MGGTSVNIPAIGQGTGDLFWNNAASRSDKVNVLHLGLDLGMALIDTGEAYGDGESELIVGDAIKGLRGEVVLATKVSEHNLTHNAILSSAEASLKRLGTEYVDIYQIHWTNPRVPVSETMGAMANLLDSGKIRYVGLCNVTESQFKEFQQALGAHKIVAIQNEFNLFERTIEYSGLISFCQANLISTIAYSPLDQGRIANMSPTQTNVLSEIANAHDKTIAQVILCWLVTHPGVVTLVRSTNLDHVRENAAASDFELRDEEVAKIDETFYEEIIQVPTERIRISLNGEWHHAVYQTLEEALANENGFAPSPVDLSRSMSDGDLLKPVRLVPSTDKDYEYDLIAGRIRYWAWVIAHQGNLPIPAYIRKDING